MKHGTMAMIARVLITTLMFLSFQSARAGMISTPQATGEQRAAVVSVIDRADVSRQLQNMGLDPQMAKDRVAAMTDDEVNALSGKLNQLPAGGIADWWLAAIVIAAVVVALYGWKK